MTLSNHLERSTPEAQGVDSTAILDFINAAESAGHELHSLLLLRHGRMLAEGWWHPYAAEHPHMLFSLSKSFTSTTVGFAVAEGLLSVDDRVVDFFPEDAPAEISPNLAAMRVRHLLAMSCGHDADVMEALFADPDGNWTRAFLAQPVQHAPGAHFAYDSSASYMLSAIVQRLTGTTVLEYLRPRLLDPLGIEQAEWWTNPRGEHTMTAGVGEERRGSTTIDPNGTFKIAATGAWISPDTYVMKAYFYEAPFSSTVTWRFAGDEVRCVYRFNVSFGPTELPEIVGRKF